MGWTFTHREKGVTNLDWFREQWCPSEPDRLIDMATVGGAFKGVAFGAYRSSAFADGIERVIGIVALTQWVPNDYYNFGWKEIDEGQGPCEDNCPERIFNLLTPLPADQEDPSVDGNWAAQWRQRVEANIAKKKAEPKVKPGTKIRFPSWRYTGGDYGIVEYVGGRRGQNLFRTSRGMVRFRGWRTGPYEVVS